MPALNGGIAIVQAMDWSNSTLTVTRTDATTRTIVPSEAMRVDIPATVTGNVSVASNVGTSVVEISVPDYSPEAIVYGGKLLRGGSALTVNVANGTPITFKQAAAADYALASWGA